MGLFGKNETCAICGEKLSLLKTASLADCKICQSCREKAPQYLKMAGILSRDDFMESMADAKKNKELYSVFAPKEIAFNIQIDYSNKLIAVATKKQIANRSAYIFRFDEIVDYGVDQDGNTIQKSGVGGAIVGGMLFGGAGFLIGGLASRKTKESITKMSITLITSNKWQPSIDIPVLTTETKKGSMTYNITKAAMEKTLDVLNMVV